jgi:Toprim domain
MSAERWVATRAIQEAVKRRESDVLQAIGIPWDDSAGHITCPYPDHADANPSWRWNERRAKAYCTCIQGSQSIFDVVMRVEGVEFDPAKLRVAEILGRQDLIRASDGKRHQAMDAASLLRPPPDLRDESLARSYLAYRLDLPPDQVPMPSTPVVTWRSLAYFDPPAKRGGQPKLVGHHPCVVFATRSPDGRSHAHRIYVAAEGAGKAELGRRTDGRPRDAKKSATLKEGQSAAGCVVLWGDPKAAHLVLGEGIETAAALALARQPEIEAGEVAVAAALSTGGIRSFQPWPATRRITIAADRDEDRPADDRGFKAGELAARAFAFAHQERVDVGIALPGEPGEDVDWLDVLRRDGLDTVRVGLDGAERFVPTAQEIDAARRCADRASKLAEIERTYPLPAMESLTLDYRHTRSGKIMVHKYAGKDKEGEEIWLPVTSPVGVPSRLRYIDEAEGYGLRVVVQGMDGKLPPLCIIERAHALDPIER